MAKNKRAIDTGEQVDANKGVVGEPFFFPAYQQTVFAASYEEALQQVQKLKNKE